MHLDFHMFFLGFDNLDLLEVFYFKMENTIIKFNNS